MDFYILSFAGSATIFNKRKNSRKLKISKIVRNTRKTKITRRKTETDKRKGMLTCDQCLYINF
jgi:hypothetical protein